jgi:cytidylate kinase
MKKRLKIAIDGPSGSGKSTVSRALADRLRYRYVDTGAMYRAIALRSKMMGVDPDDDNSLENVCSGVDFEFKNDKIFMNGKDVSKEIRTPEMDGRSSVVSARAPVRKAMINLQRKMAEGGGIVMEGRDIGTVVLKDADAKFFLTADPNVRGKRRFDERNTRGEEVDFKMVLSDMGKRDKDDSARELSPLKPDKDAKIIDTTNINVEKVLEIIMDELKKVDD